MEGIKEYEISGYPKAISYECTKKILNQMERNICKIKIRERKGTGFFCQIPIPTEEKMIKVFITNNQLIEEELLYKKGETISIYIEGENNIKEINLNNRIKYTNKEYDITIIEIKKEDEINDFLELDDFIIEDIIHNKNNNIKYIDETVYIIQYPEGKLSVSYGIIQNIYGKENYNFNHLCYTNRGSSGSPIFSLNNKVIGLHKEGVNGYNYNRGSFLNFPIKEFIQQNCKKNNEILLREFNEKYNLENNYINIERINLSYRLKWYNSNSNEGLLDLGKIGFKKLKKLYLNENELSDIKAFEKFEFRDLEILNLGNNKISDIKVLEKVNFKRLKELYLNGNKISDIKILGKVDFKNLKILNLGYIDKGESNFEYFTIDGNKISDINILEGVNFKSLKELHLNGNEISDIKVLEKVQFEELEILNLGHNKISDINVLEKANFKNLKILNLGYIDKFNYDKFTRVGNNISDINVLEKVNFKKLKELYLNGNIISNLKVLEKVQFKDLEILNLGHNKISDINVLEKVNFKRLKELYLNENIISDIKVLEKVQFLDLKILNLGHNKISDINLFRREPFFLKKLFLNHNQISDISALVEFARQRIPDLEIIDIRRNLIDKYKYPNNDYLNECLSIVKSYLYY